MARAERRHSCVSLRVHQRVHAGGQQPGVVVLAQHGLEAPHPAHQSRLGGFQVGGGCERLQLEDVRGQFVREAHVLAHHVGSRPPVQGAEGVLDQALGPQLAVHHGVLELETCHFEKPVGRLRVQPHGRRFWRRDTNGHERSSLVARLRMRNTKASRIAS